MSDVPVIGIDLGTTYSCVAVCVKGKVTTCVNDVGRNTTPSYVCFSGNDRLIGDTAKERAVIDILNTVYDAKRLIGKEFGDPAYSESVKHWPFEVVEVDNRLKIKTIVCGKDKTFYPEEISAMILIKMKKSAENFLGTDVKSAVITVPAYFNDAQREATKMAAKLADLDVIRFLNEPTAAAFAFGLTNYSDKCRIILVFDLGGGTFDVSILSIFKSKVKVLATGGNNNLGGEDFDRRMVDYCLGQFYEQTDIDLRVVEDNKDGKRKRAIRRLKNQCERAKIILSSAKETNIELDTFYNGEDLIITLSRSHFELLNADLFSTTMEIVDTCVIESKLQSEEIMDLVAVGGSSRIPKIQQLLLEKFPDKKINKSLNADEAVARGSAILADMIKVSQSKQIDEEPLIDITPMSLGVETREGKMSNVVDKGTPLPVSKSKIYMTTVDDQDSILVKVYEGEMKMAYDNNLLGEFELCNIPPARKGLTRIEVTFAIDIDNILVVSAVETSSKLQQTVTINKGKSKLPTAEFNRIMKEMEELKSNVQ